MNFYRAKNVRILMPKTALNVIFDECDRFTRDETGGRVVGTFKEQDEGLVLTITGIIESGPQAKRSSVSFFQDGEYQERIFRQVETSHPEIEHFGSWHTHHVNGLPTLSSGDIATYTRTVNHHNQNTPFFYALLVVAKHQTRHPLDRYSIKHYLFRRGDERIYEIPPNNVEIIDAPLIWPTSVSSQATYHTNPNIQALGVRPERVYDRDILGEFYQGIRPFTSPKLGLYWRGPIELSDGSKMEVVLLEDTSLNTSNYSIVLRDPPGALKVFAEELSKKVFPSARAALIMTERSCNKFLYEQRGNLPKSEVFTLGG